MTKLPNRKNAIIEISKLEKYCLNPLHQRGKHKAKVFKSALNITNKDINFLYEKLLEAAFELDAMEISTDSFGTRYYIDCRIIHNNKSAEVRSIWIIKSKEKIPRLITCYIK